MKIFLVGYMGCGKSRWGKLLAAHYGLQFVDLDTLIESQTGMDIPTIFEKYSEHGFREKEQQALYSLKDKQSMIIATGGGAACYQDNMDVMNQMGYTIYIKCSPELLRERIVNSKNERPLVKNYSFDALLTYIENHLQERLPYYEKAQSTVISGDLSIEDLIQTFDPILNSKNQ